MPVLVREVLTALGVGAVLERGYGTFDRQLSRPSRVPDRCRTVRNPARYRVNATDGPELWTDPQKTAN
jgi:hypothetical protein